MKLSKTITTAAIATLMATSSFAQDIAVIAGSIEDAFMDKIKKALMTPPIWSKPTAAQYNICAPKTTKTLVLIL